MAATSSLYGGGVKSIQRGVYSGGGGTITITAVDTAKSVISTVSKSSSGSVAATGSVTGTLTNSGGYRIQYSGYGQTLKYTTATLQNYTGTRSISGGSTSLITKQYSAVITNSTTITADGPCEWQVIEYS